MALLKSGYVEDIYYSIEDDTDIVALKIHTNKHSFSIREKEVIPYIKRYLKNKVKNITIRLDNDTQTNDMNLCIHSIKICIWFDTTPLYNDNHYLDMINRIISKIFILKEE